MCNVSYKTYFYLRPIAKAVTVKGKTKRAQRKKIKEQI